MPVDATWDGIPFALDTPDATAWIDANISLDDLTETVEVRTYPGPGLLGAAFPLRHPRRPKLRLGQFFYPTGASRWSEFHVLIGQASYDLIQQRITDAGATGPPRKILRLNDGLRPGNYLQTPMVPLPPRPLAQIGDDGQKFPGLFLASFVDERFYWQWQHCAALNVDVDTTWSDLITRLAAGLAIIPLVDPIPAAYGQPDPNSDLNALYENTAVLLDAVCWNIGMVFVREFSSGGYLILSGSSTQQRESNNLGTFGTAFLAGGDLV